MSDPLKSNGTEEALRESQRALSTLMSNLPGAAYRCRNDRDWSMLFLSAGIVELSGYSPEELTGGRPTYGSLIHPDDRDQIWEQVQTNLSNRKRFQLSYRIRCADGSDKWIWEQGVGVFDSSGTLEALEGILTDFTEHKKAIELTRAQEDRLWLQDRAMDSCHNGVIITDFLQPDNPIIFANQSIERITGYERDKILGKNCRFLQNGDVDQVGLVELRSAIADGRQCHVILRNYRKDGTPFWNELSVSPVRDATGEVSHFVGIQADITDRKEEEDARMEKLAEAQEALRRTERLVALGQLAGGVAHELRSPLGVIQNAFLYIDETTKHPDQDTRDALSEIRRGIAGAERVIAELLDYGRGAKPADRDACTLKEVVHDALLDLNIPDSVLLEIEVDEPQPRCYCDRGQISRLVHNLVRNAVQAMPDGGRLQIVCKNQAGDASVEVRDTGAGIEKDDLEKIFQPLVTTKAKGIGLGLAISRRYAEQNDGTLEVESQIGKGSVFRLTLPGET